MMGSHIDGSITFVMPLWLVPHWLENHTEQWKKPTLMIRLQKDDFMEFGKGTNYLLKYPIPLTVLKGQNKKVKGVSLDVIEVPDIKFSTRTDIH